MSVGKYERTEEIREKISKKLTGRSIPIDVRKKISVGISKIMTPELRKKIGKKLSGNKSHLWRGGLPKCKDCGKTINYRRKRCKKCASIESSSRPEVRMKLSQSHKGAKSYLWKGGITPINQSIRSSLEYRLWREAVFARDNWTCVWCGQRSGNGIKIILNADHIQKFAYFPELRFAIDNGRTLCKECHYKRHRNWDLPAF